MHRIYSKAFENRSKVSDPHVRKSRRAFARGAASNFLLLQLLFLGLFCWIFGALFQQGDHVHNINVAFVDYDGGAIGNAVRTAYSQLKGRGFPSLVEHSSSELTSAASLRREVCSTEHWAVLYVTQGSSDKLQAALAGDVDAAALNKTDILTYIWNEARYSSIVDTVVSSNLQTLSDAARIAYTTGNGTAGLTALTNSTALSVFAEPWQLTSVNIQPTTQGSRAIYNTLVFILLMIQEFFYLGTLNGLYASHRLYSRLSPTRLVISRDVISLLYCLVGSLCTTGAIWAFRAGWNVSGGQFAMNWMALWLFAHINFLQLDVFTIWLPPPYVPMALISWVIFNITSILLPFELSPAFFRIGYAAPAHEVYQVLMDIWSGGCNPHLRYALPILFSWWVCGLVLSGLGVYRRSHYAVLKEQEEARQFQQKLDVAVAWEREQEKEHRQREHDSTPAQDNDGDSATVGDEYKKPIERFSGEADDSDPEMRAELARAITREEHRLRREQSREDDAMRLGPMFSLPFGRAADSGSETDE